MRIEPLPFPTGYWPLCERCDSALVPCEPSDRGNVPSVDVGFAIAPLKREGLHLFVCLTCAVKNSPQFNYELSIARRDIVVPEPARAQS